MVDWKKYVVGDAFKLQSRDPRYYTNIFLFLPTMVFGWMLADSLWHWPIQNVHWQAAAILAALFSVCVLLLKDRRAVLFAILIITIFSAIRGTSAHHVDWSARLAAVLVSLVLIFLLYWPNRRTFFKKSDMEFSGDMDILGVSLGVSGLLLAVLTLFELRRWIDL